jgi:membrane-bound metal-dependent hydrolase YbcI (DUF457 family)
MIAGHYGLAAIVKSREPQLPLWALMLSTELLDVVFLALLPFGIESFSGGSGYGEGIISADYTHSLVGAVAISLLAAIIAAIPWGRRNGLIIGAMVFSHWVLDLIVHRGDMPLLPGNAGDFPRLGLSLWSIPLLSAAIELALVVVGSYLYYHASMRAAARAERVEAKASNTSDANAVPKGYRQRALVSSTALFVVMLGTLVANFLGY